MTSTESQLCYGGIQEKTYTSNHSDVIKWTTHFHNIINENKIFDGMKVLPKNFKTAQSVATGWHAFSEFMPWFLCLAASMVSTNQARHYVIQTAFEELGMRDCDQIHPDMFWKAANSIDIFSPDELILSENSEIKNSLKFLKERLFSYKTDMSIFGILLGLEIPAVENIETLFTAMAYDTSSERILNKEFFFKLHRIVEIEHVRLTVSNFLRFQKSDTDINLFINGFMDGIIFWKKFWFAMSSYILSSSH